MPETPPFWYEKTGLRALSLAPISWVYGLLSTKRMSRPATHQQTIPVLCVGNLVAGGAGKTPTAIALAKAAIAKGQRPAFLTRGYGGANRGPVFVDSAVHNAHDVGDEALLLAQVAPTLVAADRAAGMRAIESANTENSDAGFSIVIMDDGFQNPQIDQDFTLLVVAGHRGVGNGFAHPSGPLRAPVMAQLQRADEVLTIGEGDAGSKILRMAARRGMPLHIGTIEADGDEDLTEARVLAWSGIGDPGKFHRTLRDLKVDVVSTRNFPDHHFLRADEAQDLLDEARREGLLLVTTAKDAVRLEGGHNEELEALSAKSVILPIRMKPDNPSAFAAIIDKTLAAFRKARVARNAK
jgi:tetraacyldisaccharide 4'-kinase